MRYLALFCYGNENLHLIVREKICNYIIQNKILFNHLEFETEIGLLDLDNYIDYIKKPNAWSGELEKYAAEELFNINIADFIETKSNINNLTIHKFFADCNHDQNYDKDLCLLTSINNSHYNLLYDKKYNCFKNENMKLIFLNNIPKHKNLNINNKINLINITKVNKTMNIDYKLKKSTLSSIYNPNENKNNNESENTSSSNEGKILVKDIHENNSINRKSISNTNIVKDDDIKNNSSLNININDENDLYLKEYNNDNIYKVNYRHLLIDTKNKTYPEIISLYSMHNKKTLYSDIYKFVLSVKEGKNPRDWPKDFENITDKKNLKV